MKNNKGLTLVELLGVLVVLSLIIMIVTPVVTKNLKSSQVEICEYQLSSFVAASKNWFTDQINDDTVILYNDDGKRKDKICVSALDLKNGGYISELSDKYRNVAVCIKKNGNNYSYTTHKEVAGENGEKKYKTFDCSV